MILNLTQHLATEDQVSAGVVEPRDKDAVKAIITFGELPTKAEVKAAAAALADVAKDHNADTVLIGGAPWFMSSVEEAMTNAGIRAVYSFSRRECIETPGPNGTVERKMVFKHLAFADAF